MPTQPDHARDAAPADPPALEAIRAEALRRTEVLRAAYAHELDLSYGAHPRQAMDLYLPARPPAGPVLVFLHGGAFRGGDHHSVGYHGGPYLEAGAIFVSMSYRVVPELRFPDLVDDVEAGLDWLAARVADWGGDPERIYLSGHSAGACLAAMATLRPLRLQTPDLVKGIALISGMYDFAGRTEEDTDASSPRYVPNLAEALERVPDHAVVVSGDRDFPYCAPDADALAAAIAAKGGSVERFVEPDADHFQANRSFVDPDGAVALAVKKMMGIA